MRVRIPIAALSITAAVAACSNPSADTVLASDPTFASELELAISAASARDATPVVSELEVKQPLAARPDERVTEAPRATAGPAPVLALAVPEPKVSAPIDPDPVIRGPVTPVSDSGHDHDDHMDDGRRPTVGARPGIIIRGGVDPRDPCVIHVPGGRGGGAGSIGILINNPLPRVGGGGRYPGDGRGTSPGIGVVFHGGIR